VRSWSRGGVRYTSTSGRRPAKRWSAVMYSGAMPMFTPLRYGTGLAGSLR